MYSLNKSCFVVAVCAFLSGCSMLSLGGKQEDREVHKSQTVAPVVLPGYRPHAENGGAGRYTADKQHMLSLQAPLPGEYVNLNIEPRPKRDFVEVKIPPPKTNVKTTFESEIVVYFKTNSSDLTQEAKNLISAIGRSSDRQTKVLATGHADSVGNEKSNAELSEARVKAVVDALVSAGVNEKSITLNAKGASTPISENEHIEGRAKNRRVELRVIGYNSSVMK